MTRLDVISSSIRIDWPFAFAVSSSFPSPLTLSKTPLPEPSTVPPPTVNSTAAVSSACVFSAAWASAWPGVTCVADPPPPPAVRATGRTAALLARDAGLEHAAREVDAVAELDRLREVGVEDVALVLDHDAAPVALRDLLEELDLRGHLRLLAEDAEVLEHR